VITEFLINSLADRVSDDFISGKGNLSKLVAEAAKVNKFNDEAVKRLVEATNVATFKKLFEAKSSAKEPDRNIVFDLADFKKVINYLDDLEESESSASESEFISESSSDIEKRYPDLRNIPLTPIKAIGNILSDTLSSPGDKHIEVRITTIKKASEDIKAVFEKTKHDYNSVLADLATEFSRYNAYDLNKFASEILAISDNIKADAEVLNDIYTLCRETPKKVKVASGEYISLPRKEHELFKKASSLFNKLETLEKLKNQLNNIISNECNDNV